ncbi:3D domain-containing protein [Paenibacillus physcomitrellae]|uniref:Cell wall-binding protein YocH n=1 Tax=Paenibacillus physcomitrellae TaxID=1619311 RepID=A0ABQ1FPM9_9BACL|nr:3D domain-containing protein [Paenibacillus physcomitrellae]GGA25265.1 cell wall-binding protein YocH [Paenibacillus physcomitrellae]
MTIKSMLKSKRKSLIGKTTALVIGLSLSLQLVPAAFAANYTAKEGDTFYLLSKRYGTTVTALMNANPTVKATNIYEGLKLTIPGQEKAASTPKASAATPAKVISADANALKVMSSSKVVQAWGKTFNYSKTLNVKATAYSSAADENGKWGAVDYFGNPLELGTIAVDPNVIPMGTKVLVTGHSFAGFLPKYAFVATATDQGGAIKGNRIDIFVPGSKKDVSQFGIQDIKLFVLK